jgi:hypothetical protein
LANTIVVWEALWEEDIYAGRRILAHFRDRALPRPVPIVSAVSLSRPSFAAYLYKQRSTLRILDIIWAWGPSRLFG